MEWCTDDDHEQKEKKEEVKEALAKTEEQKETEKKEESEEDKRKRCSKFISRVYKKEKSPQVIFSRIEKKFGAIMTLEEVTEMCNTLEAKAAAAVSRSSVIGCETISADGTASPSPAKKRRRSDKTSSDDGSPSKKKKHMGRPPDEDKQRTIIETVERNPSISLRTVASSLDCSKSQVARVLALNGFQRNKGRVGEWQRVTDEDHPSTRTEQPPPPPPPPPPEEPKEAEKSEETKDDEESHKKDETPEEEKSTAEERPRKKKRNREQ